MLERAHAGGEASDVTRDRIVRFLFERPPHLARLIRRPVTAGLHSIERSQRT